MFLTVHLLKPAKDRVISYPGELLQRNEGYILVRTVWTEEMGRVDLGFVTFEPGDYLYEHFYADRWYNVFELHAPDGRLKGWYGNITYPARLHTDCVESEDLELDLFVSPDRQRILVLDEDEYAARDLAHSDPSTHEEAQQALAALRRMAAAGEEPFRNREEAGGGNE